MEPIDENEKTVRDKAIAVLRMGLRQKLQIHLLFLHEQGISYNHEAERL